MFTICLNRGRASAHDDHAVGELDGFVDIMGHEDDGLALGLPDAKQFAAHDEARDGVQRAERLVEEEHVRIDGQGARDFKPLLHAAGKLRRVSLFEPLQPDHLDVVRDAALAFCARQFEQAEADVAFDGEPGEDAAFLEDEDAARVGAAHCFAIDGYLPAGRREKSGHGIQQRRFAAAGGAEQAQRTLRRQLRD